MTGPAVDAALLLALPAGTRARRELQPLLHAVLEREGRLAALDAPHRERARRAYFSSLARTVRVRAALEAALDAGAAAGAHVLPLKGSLFAFTVYPDPAMRPMADVDVAVAPASVEAVADRLERAGYRRHGAGRRRFDLAYHHHLLLRHRSLPAIELHARLVHELEADGDLHAFFARAEPVTLRLPRARLVQAPRWDDHLLYVLMHAATHTYADSPIWLFDLLHLLPVVEDPAVLGEAARARRVVAGAHFACTLARRYVPSLSLAAPAPPLRALRAALLDRLLGPDPLAAPPSRPVSRVLRLVLTDEPIGMLRSFVRKAGLVLAERLFEAPSPRARAR